jgi:hypothetical protein
MSKRALLIGCNYTATPSVQLQGCINDIVNIRNMLIDAYGYQDSNIYMLRDDDKNRLPTRANILSSLSSIISSSNSTDTVWIHYSGHGTQIRDTNGDESDKLDECIVPSNYNIAGFITDDDLVSIIQNAKCQLILCFDSCNSGTVCDLQYSMNYSNGVFNTVINNSKIITDTNIIMLSGSRDTQTSADAYDSLARQGCGAFTHSLIEALRMNSHNVDLLKLYADLCVYLSKSGFTQIPVLSSTIAKPSYKFARIPVISLIPSVTQAPKVSSVPSTPTKLKMLFT